MNQDLVYFIGFDPVYCPICLDKEDLAFKTKTLDTRHFVDTEDHQPYVQRRHQCPNCANAFYTIERTMQ